jgi:drug/metabolite transporter (DMT)-like permease
MVAALVLLPAALIGGGLAVSGADFAYLFVLGVVLTGGVNIVFVAALRWVPATTAGILAYMEPVSGAVLAAILLGEDLTAPVIVGGLAIVAAGVAVVRDAVEPDAVPAPAASRSA